MSNASNLFDTLRARFELKSDRMLGKELGVAPPVISKTRDRGTVSPEMMIRIHERWGLTFIEIRALAEQPAPSDNTITRLRSAALRHIR